MTSIIRSIAWASLFGTTLCNLLKPFVPNASAGAQHFQPVMDWDKNTCYSTAAIDANSNINEGSAVGLRVCRAADRLWNDNTYVRQRCNRGWCVYLYAYYFEEDVGSAFGHRHDWEHAQVWTKDHVIQDVRWTSHGNYHRKWAGHGDVRYQGSHFKLVSHLGGSGTSSLRLAEAKDDAVENDMGRWEQAWLVDLDRMSSNHRSALMQHDFGSAHLDLIDGRFGEKIIEGMPDRARQEGFDAAWDDPNGHWN